MVIRALVLLNVTVPDPDTLLQVVVKVEPVGKPSSVAAPVNETEFVGKVMVLSTPTLTVGGWLDGGGASPVMVKFEMV